MGISSIFFAFFPIFFRIFGAQDEFSNFHKKQYELKFCVEKFENYQYSIVRHFFLTIAIDLIFFLLNCKLF